MAFVTCPFQFRMGLGFEPAFRRHRSEEPVSEAAALAAAVPTEACAASHRQQSSDGDIMHFHESLSHDLHRLSAGPAEKETIVMMSEGRGDQSLL